MSRRRRRQSIPVVSDDDTRGEDCSPIPRRSRISFQTSPIPRKQAASLRTVRVRQATVKAIQRTDAMVAPLCTFTEVSSVGPLQLRRGWRTAPGLPGARGREHDGRFKHPKGTLALTQSRGQAPAFHGHQNESIERPRLWRGRGGAAATQSDRPTRVVHRRLERSGTGITGFGAQPEQP